MLWPVTPFYLYLLFSHPPLFNSLLCFSFNSPLILLVFFTVSIDFSVCSYQVDVISNYMLSDADNHTRHTESCFLFRCVIVITLPATYYRLSVSYVRLSLNIKFGCQISPVCLELFVLLKWWNGEGWDGSITLHGR